VDSYLAYGLEIYPKARENLKAFPCISDPIFLESSIQYPWRVGLHYRVQLRRRREGGAIERENGRVWACFKGLGLGNAGVFLSFKKI